MIQFFISVQLPVCDSFLNLRLLLSFFCERKEPHSRPLAGMSKAIPGRRSPSPEAAPPPARSSRIPASVIRCLCNAPEMGCCDIACNAALTRCPSRMGEDVFLLCRPHEDSVSCSRSGDGGAVTSAAYFSLSVSFVHFVCLFSFSQPRCFTVLIVFPCSCRSATVF